MTNKTLLKELKLDNQNTYFFKSVMKKIMLFFITTEVQTGGFVSLVLLYTL